MRTILPLAGSAVLLAAFALIESRHPAPLVPLRILRSRTLVGANAVTLLIGTVAVGMPFVLTLYAQQVLGYSPVKFGVSSVVLAVAVTVAAIAGQAAVLKVGFRSVAATGMALMGAGSLVLTQVSVRRQLLPGHLLRAAPLRSRDRPRLRDRHGRGARGRRRARVRARLGPQQHRLADRHSARRRHRLDRCRLPLRSDYLAANKGANPLVVLTEGYQSAFVACAVLAGIGLALALLLPGRPRKAAHELPEPVLATGAGTDERSFDIRYEHAPARAASTNERRTEMGKIVISENVSLDGVVQDPAGDEGFGHGGWVGVSASEIAKRRPRSCSTRRWAPRPSCSVGEATSSSPRGGHPGAGELADRLNSMPKYVVSSTLEDPDWNNSTVLKGDVVSEVSKLKQELDGDIVVAGSIQLVRTLMEHDLVDELRLMIYPVVLGAGERLFGETSDKKPMRLVDTRTVERRSPTSPTSSSETPSGRGTAPAFRTSPDGQHTDFHNLRRLRRCS